MGHPPRTPDPTRTWARESVLPQESYSGDGCGRCLPNCRRVSGEGTPRAGGDARAALGLLPRALRFHGRVAAIEATQGPGWNSPRDLQGAEWSGAVRGLLQLPAKRTPSITDVSRQFRGCRSPQCSGGTPGIRAVYRHSSS